ncbi:MAG: hypothetical protein WD467_00445 [Candidatus Saccharimonadales bacterium]
MHEKNGLRFTSWDDVKEHEGTDTIERISPNCDLDRPDLPDELREEMQALYPPENWGPLWDLEERRSFMFNRIISVAAEGEIDARTIVAAYRSRDALQKLKEDAKTLLRRQAARNEFRRLKIASRSLETADTA